MKQKIYLYAGYYELYITDKTLDAPYVLLSTHRTVRGAERAAVKLDVQIHYAEHLVPEEIEDVLSEDASWETANVQDTRFAINLWPAWC